MYFYLLAIKTYYYLLLLRAQTERTFRVQVGNLVKRLALLIRGSKIRYKSIVAIRIWTKNIQGNILRTL